jgi:S-adenosylmethionine:tRNA ribosyltransferase-isomerase
MQIRLEDYAYVLPPELIAKEPARPRDSARLMVVNTKTGRVSFDIFRNLPRYLPRESLLVLNETKVVPARVTLYKETGGKVIALFLLNEYRGGAEVRALLDREVASPASLYLSKEKRGPAFTVVGQEANVFILKTECTAGRLIPLLQKHGATPIPPYLKDTPLLEEELRKRYQTVFAKRGASVAAPTASLHFTPRVFKTLKKKGISTAQVTLNVGLGTFAPISEESFKTKKLHKEWYEIPLQSARAVARARADGRPIVAVGTTVVRTIESASSAITSGRTLLLKWERGSVSGATDLFIFPPYDFKLTDVLITNFHVPRSSLMCLVDAFLEHKKSPRRIMELYRLAIKNRMRFFSFGDCMLIL